MSVRTSAALAAAITLGAFALPQVSSAAITDPVGVFLPTYTGTVAGDLDVIAASLTFDPVANTYLFSGTLDASVSTTSTAFYVLGINRGAGTARFAANGVLNVLFDTTVIIQQNGSVAVNLLVPPASATPLPAGTATFNGATINLLLSGSLLPSAGFAANAYTWNFWPRDSLVAGFAAIPDFAPDASNAQLDLATRAVPVPASALLLIGGLGLIGWKARSRSKA